MLHYIIIAAIIFIIVMRQWKYYRDTQQKINILRLIFPEKKKYEYVTSYDINEESNSGYINVKHDNTIFTEIIRAINAYLNSNKGNVSDFHLMKDIVDRNCDAAEEEIDSQVPVPLYLGLMGTMAGILVGVGYLWISGDLDSLLDAGKTFQGTNQGTSADGVKALLGGVALAMISSIMGIFLTTRGSLLLKKAKADLQKRKHVFLSWMQANMLPYLNNDTAQVLERMTRNLDRFNQEFDGNTKELGIALAKVTETTRLQTHLIELVNQIDNKQLAKENLDLYKALRDSTDEIGKLAELLHDSTEYLDAVRKLNAKLDKGERRNKAIEHMVEFFETETQQIELRKTAMTHTIGQIDSTLEENLRQLGQHAQNNIEIFYRALGKQQDALQQKLDETASLIKEIQNLSSIKDSIAKFERATREQNNKIDTLTKAIMQLAESKSNVEEVGTVLPAPKKVRWKKLILTLFVILIILSIAIANWEEILDVFDLL